MPKIILVPIVDKRKIKIIAIYIKAAFCLILDLVDSFDVKYTCDSGDKLIDLRTGSTV